MRRYPWFEILLVTILMAISLYAALSDAQNLSWRWFTRDDAYYYFKVAQNISEGRGSTFDGLNPSNGYHPLWMLVCIPIFALARFDVILPLRVLLLVMSALSAGTAILFYRLLGKVFHPAIGALAAVYWAFNYGVLLRVYQQGLETGLAVFFVVLLVYRLYEFEKSWRTGPVTNRQLLTLGLIGLLMTFSRLDLIFLAGMAGIWIIFRASPLRYFLPLDVASILASVLLSFLLRLSLREYYIFNDAALTMVAVSMLAKIPLAYFLGLYDLTILSKTSKLIARLAIFLLIGSALITVSMLIVAAVRHFEGFPRITVAYDLMLTAVFFGATRFSAAGLRSSFISAQPSTSLIYLRDNWKRWLAEGIAYYGVLIAGMAIYMLYNKSHFGTFSPVSGQIKRWWGSLPGRVYGGSVVDQLSFFGLSYETEANTWHPLSSFFGAQAEKLYRVGLLTGLIDYSRYLIILAIFILCFYLVLFINKQKAKSSIVELAIIPLFASTWLQVLSYNALGYSAFKEWYWITQPVVIVLVLGLLLGMLFQPIKKIPYAPAATWILALWYGVSLLNPFWSLIRTNMTYGEWKPFDPNNDIAAFLEANTEPGSVIGLTGGGNAGYFIHDRTVINMDGLINSYEYFQLLKDKKAAEHLANEGMDYVLANLLILDQLPYRGQFSPYFELTGKSYGGKSLMRFHVP
ncbi:MAG TPA: hypothetical protein VFR47_13525 [Anaerolineales bacterium]|nr:hypothetical protein [Anaerolineales bacterium]